MKNLFKTLVIALVLVVGCLSVNTVSAEAATITPSEEDLADGLFAVGDYNDNTYWHEYDYDFDPDNVYFQYEEYGEDIVKTSMTTSKYRETEGYYCEDDEYNMYNSYHRTINREYLKESDGNLVKLDKTEVTLKKGKSTTLTLENVPGKIEWVSSDEKVATVKNGKVKAVGAGTAVIEARVDGEIFYSDTEYKAICRGFSNSEKYYPVIIHNTPGKGKTYSYCCTVTVEAGNKVELNKKELNLNITENNSYKLKLKNATGTVTWKSSDTKVATVSSTGKVTAKGFGTAVISAKCGSKTYKCNVNVTDVTVKFRQPDSWSEEIRKGISIGSECIISCNDTYANGKFSVFDDYWYDYNLLGERWTYIDITGKSLTGNVEVTWNSIPYLGEYGHGRVWNPEKYDDNYWENDGDFVYYELEVVDAHTVKFRGMGTCSYWLDFETTDKQEVSIKVSFSRNYPDWFCQYCADAFKDTDNDGIVDVVYGVKVSDVYDIKKHSDATVTDNRKLVELLIDTVPSIRAAEEEWMHIKETLDKFCKSAGVYGQIDAVDVCDMAVNTSTWCKEAVEWVNRYAKYGRNAYVKCGDPVSQVEDINFFFVNGSDWWNNSKYGVGISSEAIASYREMADEDAIAKNTSIGAETAHEHWGKVVDKWNGETYDWWTADTITKSWNPWKATTLEDMLAIVPTYKY